MTLYPLNYYSLLFSLKKKLKPEIRLRKAEKRASVTAHEPVTGRNRRVTLCSMFHSETCTYPLVNVTSNNNNHIKSSTHE